MCPTCPMSGVGFLVYLVASGLAGFHPAAEYLDREVVVAFERIFKMSFRCSLFSYTYVTNHPREKAFLSFLLSW